GGRSTSRSRSGSAIRGPRPCTGRSASVPPGSARTTTSRPTRTRWSCGPTTSIPPSTPHASPSSSVPFQERRSSRPAASDERASVKILAIETSCDETAAAVVEDGRIVLSSVVSSQIDVHARFGGVVPEMASRAHLELLTPVVAEAMVEAGVDGRELDAVAATVGPGLIGSLLVGVSAAKAYSLAWDVPFVGVNHMEAHLHAAFLEEPELALPVIVMLVSGGHTMLISMEAAPPGTAFPFVYRLLGQTIGDAAGEAFDKVARYLGLGYPGGPAIDRIAVDGDPSAIPFPRGLRDGGYAFSFRGLKTSVITYVRKHPSAGVADVAASFQEAVVDTLVTKA